MIVKIYKLNELVNELVNVLMQEMGFNFISVNFSNFYDLKFNS